MNWFKRIIVKLFNIHAEDFPEVIKLKAQIDQLHIDQLKARIPKQVDQQEKHSLKNLEKSPVQKSASESPLPNTFLNPELTPSPATGKRKESSSIEEEFPLIDDESIQDSGIQPQIKTDSPVLETIEVIAEPISEPEVTLPFEDILPLGEPLEPITEIQPSKPFERLTRVQPGLIRIGIDFGTTTTAVSLKIGDDLPQALPIGKVGSENFIPSVIYVQPGKGDLATRVIVGDEAENFPDQANTFRSIKRCLACDGKNCQGLKIGNERRFSGCKGDGTFVTSTGEILHPNDLVTFIIQGALTKAIKLIRERYKFDITMENVAFQPLNLGCGAKFNIQQREILVSVANRLGFKTVTIENIIEEPIVAGFAFTRLSHNPLGKSLIYDFGGGTFDVAVIDVDRTAQGNRVTVLSTNGEQWLGGDDIDTLVYDYFLQHIPQEFWVDPDRVESKLSQDDRLKLRDMARSAKVKLSSTLFYSDTFIIKHSESIPLEISRDQFEQLLEKSKLFEKSLESARRACQIAYTFENAKDHDLVETRQIIKFSMEDMVNFVDRVILVGGITKIPYVANNLKQLFGRKLVDNTVIDPVAAVAIGCAYPHDPQHFSLASPPYQIYLEGNDAISGKTERVDIYNYFEYYDFFSSWSTNTWPTYLKLVSIPFDLAKAKLYYKKAGNPERIEHSSLGYFQGGEWQFAVTLAGEMYARIIGGDQITINTYPHIHPIQKAITDARRDRLEKSRVHNNTYDQDIQSMMTDK